jgi:RHS repeat-associated protein
VETNTYGTLGRVVQQRDAANGLWTFAYTFQSYAGSYSSGGNSVTDPRGVVRKYIYDADNRVTQRDTYDGTTLLERLQWTYNANGDVTGFTDAAGRQHSVTYDSRGNVLTATADSGSGGLSLQSSFTYNATNDPLTATDPLSHTTTLTYDSRGNPLTATNALNQATTFTYDATTGDLLTATDATSRTTTFGYNAAGDLTSIQVPGGATWTLAYDAAGRPTSVTDPLMHTTTVALDGMGRVTSVTNALNQTTSLLYDAVGNRTRLTDALGRQTNYAYDALDRLTSVTDAMSPAGVTGYGYDANGNLTSVTNALGKVWSYTYDKRNRLLTATDPLTHQASYTYDANSNVSHVQKPDGTTNRFVYDRVNRLTGVDFANNSTLDIQYAYDTASRRTGMTDGTGTTTYAYDNADRLTSVTAPNTGTVSYGYDAAGRQTSITYPTTNHQVTYGYNTRGELASVQAWTVGTTSYSYDAAGRLTGVATPNGVSSTLAYDIADRLTSITHVKGMTTLEDIQYVVNAVGNRTQMTDSVGTTNWTYDNLDRLTNVSYPNGDTVAYGYDKVGNRTSHTINGVVKMNSFDDANRMTASGTDSYTYDANGNQTSKTIGSVTTTYSYDALDRLTGISGPVTASYAYNGDGLRVSKTVGGTTTRFTWDVLGIGQVIADGNEYVWGHGLVGQVTAGGTATYAHADGLGSIRLLTDAMGAVVGTKQYDAFGAARSTTGLTLPFGYTGEQEGAESGLVYLRARFMDPQTARFAGKDPWPGYAVDPSSQHSYTYGRNNPNRWTDPSGLIAAPVSSGASSPSCDMSFLMAQAFPSVVEVSDDCGSVRLELTDEGGGELGIRIRLHTSNFFAQITMVQLEIRWVNVTNPADIRGRITATRRQWPSRNARYNRTVNTAPGNVIANLSGRVTLLGGATCSILPTAAGTTVS